MTYFATTLYVNRLFQSSPKIATADISVSSIIDGVLGYVKSLWDPNEKFASVMNFLGPGLLAGIGLPWLAVAYEVASALGFNWEGFWKSIKDGIWDIFTGGTDQPNLPDGQKPTEQGIFDRLTAMVTQAFDSNSKDTVDEAKLAQLQKDHGNIKLPELPKTEAARFDHSHMGGFIREAGIFSFAAKRSRNVLGSIFKRIIPFLLTKAAISLGFAVGGGVLHSVVAPTTPTGKDAENGGTGPNGNSSTPAARDPILALKLAPLSSDMTETHDNDDTGSVWLETGNIGQIRNYMTGWISQAYPQLQDKMTEIEESPKFLEIEGKFRARNTKASGLQIYSVPKPFERKIDIVSYIISGYLKDHKQ